HLTRPHMRQIHQRVTMRCEVKPLSREDVSGYVSHRLGLAGATKERLSFSPAALDLVHRASAGIPRVINLICDRALTRGHVDPVAVIDPVIIAKAMGDLRIASPSLPIADVAINDMRSESELNVFVNMARTMRREAEAPSHSLPIVLIPEWKTRVA